MGVDRSERCTLGPLLMACEYLLAECRVLTMLPTAPWSPARRP